MTVSGVRGIRDVPRSRGAFFAGKAKLYGPVTHQGGEAYKEKPRGGEVRRFLSSGRHSRKLRRRGFKIKKEHPFISAERKSWNGGGVPYLFHVGCRRKPLHLPGERRRKGILTSKDSNKIIQSGTRNMVSFWEVGHFP